MTAENVQEQRRICTTSVAVTGLDRSLAFYRGIGPHGIYNEAGFLARDSQGQCKEGNLRGSCDRGNQCECLENITRSIEFPNGGVEHVVGAQAHPEPDREAEGTGVPALRRV
jgi:hypothetical protein